MLKKIKADPKLKIIVGITSITLLWMASGIFKEKKEEHTANISTAANVKFIESEAKIRTKYLSFAAIATAHQEVNLTPQIIGIVEKKFVKDGDQLKAGDKILQIRNEALAKRVAHMEQALESAKLQYKSADELSKRKLGSELNLENAALALKAAEADLTSARTTFDNSIFMAPFDGIIDNISVKEGDLVANFGAGHSTIGRFINLESVEARAYLSQYERNEIYESEEAIIIKNDDEQISAKITFIAKSANPNTGTFLVKAVGENAIKIVDGEAISLKIKVGDVQSHNVPISAVILDKSGDLSIKILEKNNQVKEVKINLVDEDDKGVWIAGLPQQCKIILAG